jgi:hypothetical protein
MLYLIKCISTLFMFRIRHMKLDSSDMIADDLMDLGNILEFELSIIQPRFEESRLLATC